MIEVPGKKKGRKDKSKPKLEKKVVDNKPRVILIRRDNKALREDLTKIFLENEEIYKKGFDTLTEEYEFIHGFNPRAGIIEPSELVKGQIPLLRKLLSITESRTKGLKLRIRKEKQQAGESTFNTVQWDKEVRVLEADIEKMQKRLEYYEKRLREFSHVFGEATIHYKSRKEKYLESKKKILSELSGMKIKQAMNAINSYIKTIRPYHESLEIQAIHARDLKDTKGANDIENMMSEPPRPKGRGFLVSPLSQCCLMYI